MRNTALFSFGILLCRCSAGAHVCTRTRRRRRRPRPKRPGVTTPGVRIPITKLKPDAVYDVPGAPDWMAIDKEVWVSNSPKNSVTRLDPKSNTSSTTFAVGKNPVLGPGRRVRQRLGPQLRRLDLTRLDLKDGKAQATFPLTIADDEGGVAIGAGSFWILTDTKGTLARIDPATNKVVAEIYVAPGSFAVAFGENAVWVTSTEKNLLTRVNAQTNVIEADHPGRPEAAVPHRRRRRGVDAQPGRRLDLARRPEDEQGGRDDRSRHPRRRRRDLRRRRIGVGDVVRVPDHADRSVDQQGRAAVLRRRRRRDPRRPRLVWLTNIRAGNVWRLDPSGCSLRSRSSEARGARREARGARSRGARGARREARGARRDVR